MNQSKNVNKQFKLQNNLFSPWVSPTHTFIFLSLLERCIDFHSLSIKVKNEFRVRQVSQARVGFKVGIRVRL